MRSEPNEERMSKMSDRSSRLGVRLTVKRIHLTPYPYFLPLPISPHTHTPKTCPAYYLSGTTAMRDDNSNRNVSHPVEIVELAMCPMT